MGPTNPQGKRSNAPRFSINTIMTNGDGGRRTNTTVHGKCSELGPDFLAAAFLNQPCDDE